MARKKIAAARRIESLTPEQEALLTVVRDEWLAHGLSTQPADRPAAEAGVRLAYERAGLAAPEAIVWLRSPLEGAVGSALLAQVRDQVWAQVRTQVGAQVWDQVGDQVGENLWGQHDAGWLAWCDVWDRLGLDVTRTDGLRAVARSAGWWWAYERVAILTERPTSLHRDDAGRLHRPDGAAIAYPDGWGVWAWHGVRVPREVIEQPITIDQVRAERNAEVARVMIERYGHARYVRDIGATVVHRDDWGTLWEAQRTNDTPLRMVEVVNSTPEPDGSIKTYWLRVPPPAADRRETCDDCTTPIGAPATARDAVAWTFALCGNHYTASMAAQT